jgi:hypothetical protein
MDMTELKFRQREFPKETFIDFRRKRKKDIFSSMGADCTGLMTLSGSGNFLNVTTENERL